MNKRKPSAPAAATSMEHHYRLMSPGSARLHERARRSRAEGLTHDSRTTSPYPLYMARGEGARKWDADENECFAFMGGDGALLLGYGHSTAIAAVHGVDLNDSPGGLVSPAHDESDVSRTVDAFRECLRWMERVGCFANPAICS